MPRRAVRATRLMAVILGLVVGGSPATAQDEPPPVTIRDLSWKGVDSLSEGLLEDHILTGVPPTWRFWKPDPPFSEALLERDLERIEALYRNHGYYDARASYQLDWNEALTRVSIEITVEEGLPVRTTELSIRLLPLPGEEPEIGRAQLLEDLPLRQGSRFALEAYGAAKEKVLGRLADAGFPAARITGGAEVDVRTQRAEVSWDIHPGPRVHFGPVRIEGLERVEERLVRRRLAVGPGDLYSVSRLERTRRRLQALGLFRWVVVTAQPPQPEGPAGAGTTTLEAVLPDAADAGDLPTLEPDSTRPPPAEPEVVPDVWPVLVDVAERPPRSVQLGAGAGTEEYVRGRAAWRDRNFFGGSRRLGATLRSSLPAERLKVAASLTVDFLQPQLFDTNLDFVAETSVRLERQTAFDARRSVTRVGVSRPLWEYWVGSAGYQYSINDITALSSGLDIDEPEGMSTLSKFDFGLSRTTVDDLLDSRDGSRVLLSVEPAIGALGGDFAFLRLRAEGRRFIPWGPVVFAGRLELAAIQPLRDTEADEIPLTERLYSGGTESFRGVAYQALGPRDAEGDPAGGTTLAEASLELRFPIWKKLGGVVFTDAAQVDLDPFELTAAAIEVSTGFGLRYNTAVGPLRGDVGFRLLPGDELGGYRFHVSVGQAF